MKLSDEFKAFLADPEAVLNTVAIFCCGMVFGVILAVYVGVWK